MLQIVKSEKVKQTAPRGSAEMAVNPRAERTEVKNFFFIFASFLSLHNIHAEAFVSSAVVRRPG